MPKRELFGGACAITLAEDFQDISMFREVPDNQEVYASVESDDSVAVEFLELAEVADDEMAAYHFSAIAELNDVQPSDMVVENVKSNVELPKFYDHGVSYTCQVLRGYQMVSKFNDAALNRVHIYLAVIRLPHVTTDLTVSWNHPTDISSESSSAGAPVSAIDISDAFERTLSSFEVVDWSIFGGDDESD